MNAEKAEPNILWVFADQLRGQALGCAGDPNARTPNIDRLASEGVRFASACSTYPLCVPFRFTILTGEYAHTRWIPALDWRMSPTERTIAHEFNESGYDTIYIGKWHLNGSVPPARAQVMNRIPVLPGYRGGFQEWHAFNLRNDYFDTCCFHGDDLTPVPLGKYQTDGLFDIAIDCLKRYGVHREVPEDRVPFFMVLSLEAPHPPHQAPQECLERVRERGIKNRPNVRFAPPEDGLDYPPSSHMTENRLLDAQVGYYAQIDNLDDNMGRLLAYLESAGLLENTVVMFFSDHGEFLGSHGLRSKQGPREESINIPLIVYDARNRSRAGACLSDPVCTEDIYVTTLSLAGLSASGTKPGLDLVPYMKGDIGRLPRAGVYLELVEEHRPQVRFYYQAWRGIRTARFKYTTLDGRPWHLFDLTNDPYEMDNLVDDPPHSQVRQELHKALRATARESQDSYWMEAENA